MNEIYIFLNYITNKFIFFLQKSRLLACYVTSAKNINPVFLAVLIGPEAECKLDKMHLTALHHVELCVRNGKQMTSYFTDKLGYSLRATRETALSRQWVVKSQKSIFVVTQRKLSHNSCLERSRGIPFTSFCCGDSHQIDSVFNVGLEIKNIESVTNRMEKLGGILYQAVTEVEDENGIVKYSIVGSCCGNVVHTLLDKSKYKGQFLPTYNTLDCWPLNDEPITHCDHLTYVCHAGQSEQIIAWYRDCLGMQKFKTNPKEDLTEGLVIRDGVGMVNF